MKRDALIKNTETNRIEYIYKTPSGLSDLCITCEGEHLIGLSFVKNNETEVRDRQHDTMPPVLKDTIRWLDIYFGGYAPTFIPNLKLYNPTDFRREVIEIMMSIPYGATMTYGDIAALIAKKRGIKRMSAQAVGGAVGWNPICIIVPCHRVVGTNNSLTGYGGGMNNKVLLLKHEGHDMNKFFVP